MLRYLKLAPLVLLVSAAEAQPVRTERVTGDGFMRSSFGITVEFGVDATQVDPDAPEGSIVAAFFSFPQHLFMTFESTSLESIAVDRRTALVTGTAFVSDDRSGFLGEVEFSAVFEDLNRNPDSLDELTMTLHLPTGAETFAGGIVPGDVEVRRRRQ